MSDCVFAVAALWATLYIQLCTDTLKPFFPNNAVLRNISPQVVHFGDFLEITQFSVFALRSLGKVSICYITSRAVQSAELRQTSWTLIFLLKVINAAFVCD